MVDFGDKFERSEYHFLKYNSGQSNNFGNLLEYNVESIIKIKLCTKCLLP